MQGKKLQVLVAIGTEGHSEVIDVPYECFPCDIQPPPLLTLNPAPEPLNPSDPLSTDTST